MLSIGKLTGPGSERYYTVSVASGREDYYAGKGEAPGYWIGGATDLLAETDRPVGEQELAAVMNNRAPSGGQQLRAAPTARSVCGFDLTFSAPKSVSVLFGIGDEHVARQTREAHDAAVADALGYLERRACWTRRGKGGRETVKGKGFIAAAFRHRTSRAGDPALHTHVVIGNLTQRDDGQWTALDARHLYRQMKTAGYLYQAALRGQLTERLGVQWTVVERGAADVLGVSREVIEHFSRRRAEILDHMLERGEHTARAAHVAALDTRRRKQRDVPVDRLREEWQARAAEHGLGPAELQATLDRLERFPQERIESARRSLGLELTTEHAAFDRRAVIQAHAELHRDGASVVSLEDEADGWLASPHAVQLETTRSPAWEPRHSTPEMLTLERELLDAAANAHGSATAIVPATMVDTVLQARGDLADEQAALVRAVTSSGDGIQLIRAAAGTGKTYALDAAREAWHAAGYEVRGAATSARAAAELRDHTGMPTTTIAGLRLDLRRGHNLDDRTVLVVDEAATVGTCALHEIARHTTEVGAKLVLAGDDKQLPEIAAGGAFTALAERLGATELHEVRRQRHEWDRKALASLRAGDIAEWADAYRENGRLIGGTDAETTRARLADDWYRATRAHPGQDALMIALRKTDVADLNQRARDRLDATGQLGGVELEVGGRRFAAGDRVIAGHNDRRLGLANGDRATVTDVDADRRSITVDRGGESIELSATYLDAGHLDHAYAITAHRAQGATVDRTFVLGSDELYREWGYTALTRHREEARFYVNLPLDQDTLPGLGIEDPGGEVQRPLGRSRSKTLALDTIPERGAPAIERRTSQALDDLLGPDREATIADELDHVGELADTSLDLGR